MKKIVLGAALVLTACGTSQHSSNLQQTAKTTSAVDKYGCKNREVSKTDYANLTNTEKNETWTCYSTKIYKGIIQLEPDNVFQRPKKAEALALGLAEYEKCKVEG